MNNKKINYYRVAAVCFAISGAAFILISMFGDKSYSCPLRIGMSLVVLGMVFSGLAVKHSAGPDGK